MQGSQPTARASRRKCASLIKAGCKKVFRETASGAKTDRSQLRKALNQLDAGDVLLVTRLDRLARSTRDLPRTHVVA
jgi:DNA invertase Pin-like site-specific DNA recombinase